MSEEDEVANALTDGADDEELRPAKPRKQAKPRTRPVHQRVAKGRGSGSSAASSEVDTEPEAAGPPKARENARKQKAAPAVEPDRSDEEEPESNLVVLNGDTPSPRETPPPISKGSARKRRRDNEEGEAIAGSQKKKKDNDVNPPLEEDDDDDDFVGRRLKRIKR